MDRFDLQLLAAGIAVVFLLSVGLIVGAIVMLSRSTRARRARQESKNLTIDINSLDTIGPKENEIGLSVYGFRSRLAVLVLAPLGREGRLPDSEQLRHSIEYLLPGLAEVLDHHRPIFRRWPAQLSAKGFPQFLFANLKLPGNEGKGTPWCGLAGRFSVNGETFLAGLILCGDRPNNLGQVIVEHEGKWNDILRIEK